MSKRVPKLLLGDILEAASKIKIYTKGFSYTNFIADSKTTDAVIRNFEIIGEAAGRLSEEFKEQYSIVDWFRIKGFRNRIVHDYMGIDYEIVWTIIEKDLALLESEVKKIFDQL
ncbi:MAG TPA: DUF86 domain-containing protein [Bacteroidia bacterium]|jgi:uncharacterized protein with HEPN domain|nr:DUF86 domain-containing protein [Bacteroidia bacterium]